MQSCLDTHVHNTHAPHTRHTGTHRHRHKHTETGAETDRPAGRQVDRQTQKGTRQRQTARQKGKDGETKADRPQLTRRHIYEIGKLIDANRFPNIQTKKTDGDRPRQRQTHRDGEAGRQTDGRTLRQAGRLAGR